MAEVTLTLPRTGAELDVLRGKSIAELHALLSQIGAVKVKASLRVREHQEALDTSLMIEAATVRSYNEVRAALHERMNRRG